MSILYALIAMPSLVVGVAFGLLIRKYQARKNRRRITELEDEMLRNHARILTLEKELSDCKREAVARRAPSPTGRNLSTSALSV